MNNIKTKIFERNYLFDTATDENIEGRPSL